MEILAAAILGIIQGLTEFLPVSSSAHLILLPWFFGWNPQGLFFDVALHVGTALALVSYFWSDWVALAVASWRGIMERRPFGDPKRLLAWYLIVGTIPAVMVGLTLEGYVAEYLRTPAVTLANLVVFGALLYFSERTGKQTRSLDQFNWGDSIWIGLSQAVALMPGVSRSGITISAAMLRGSDRLSAARFSFLLSTPAIVGAGILESWYLLESAGQVSEAGSTADAAFPWGVLAVGICSATVTGFLCLRYFLRYLQTSTFTPFVVYRLLLAAVALLWYLQRPA